jgi:exopolyphosphatase/pppGpp-phosphohydrolase
MLIYKLNFDRVSMYMIPLAEMLSKSQVHACIDLGSNMCRILIATPNPNKALGFQVLKTSSNLVSLGKNSSVIDNKGTQRMFEALQKCIDLLKPHRNASIQCVATAIFRSASNGAEVLNLIYERFGLIFRISDPGEEVMFSAVGCRDILLEGTSFLMDMGGGSTEIGLFSKNRNVIQMLNWISLPYGLFYFGTTFDYKKPIPTDSHKALSVFISDSLSLIKGKISITICRSGIISNYICKRNGIRKEMIHGRIFEISHIIKVINSILEMSDIEIIQQKLISNTSHLVSTRGTLNFTKDILRQLPVQFVVLGNGGVKEGMMCLACSSHNK